MRRRLYKDRRGDRRADRQVHAGIIVLPMTFWIAGQPSGENVPVTWSPLFIMTSKLPSKTLPSAEVSVTVPEVALASSAEMPVQVASVTSALADASRVGGVPLPVE